jgi:hypothetical protein
LEKFISENGDINYFSGLASSELDAQQRLAHGSAHAIHVIFKGLERLQEDLIDLKETCEDSLIAVCLYLPTFTRVQFRRIGAT